MEAVDRWRDMVPEGSRVETGIAAGFVAGGLLAAAVMLLGKRRGFFAWAIPGAIFAVGAVLLSDVVIDVRAERILEAEDRIHRELASLDPLARAQVLKSVGEQEVETVFGD
jgi:hypothetical protein